nr:integrase, catalytic region, zinc finger, CCHC-type, peptidase aspartic, catalytic [Tanacetum cinerariifolium]
MLLMQAQENRVNLDEEQLLFLTGGQPNTDDDEVDERPVQDMAQNEDNIFHADQCDAFDSDVDEAPTAQTMFMTNLSSADLVYDEAGPSMEEIEDLNANICLMARIQPTNQSSDVGPSYDSTFISEIHSSSINENEEKMYPTHTKIINSTIGEDQIDSNIIFVTPNGNVNSGSVEKDTHVPDLWVNSNKNVIAPEMYKVVTPQETQNSKSGLSSTGMNGVSSIKRSMNRDSHDKNSILANSKNSAKQVAVYVRKNKQTDNTFANVISNKENIIDDDVANASKAENLLCVSCMQNVLISCHDKCHRLNANRTLTTKSRTPKSSGTTYVVLKTRFSEKST